MNNSNLCTRDKKFYFALFKSTFLISAFTVGGGMVIIPLLRKKFVDEYGWINDKDTLDIVAVAQSMPGVMAVNASIMLGYRMAGIYGTLVALLATILPPLITMTAISFCYDMLAGNQYIQVLLQGMQCGATAIILSVSFNLIKKLYKKKHLIPILIFTSNLLAILLFDTDLFLCIFVDGLLGLLFLRGEKYN